MNAQLNMAYSIAEGRGSSTRELAQSRVAMDARRDARRSRRQARRSAR